MLQKHNRTTKLLTKPTYSVGPCVGLSVITRPTNSEPPGVLVEPVLPFRVLHSSHQLLPKASHLFVVRVADLGANIFRRHNVPAHQDFWVCWSHAQGPCSFRKSLACSRSEVFRIFADRVPPFGCRASLADKKWPNLLGAALQRLAELRDGVQRLPSGASRLGQEAVSAFLQGRPFGPVEALEKRSVLPPGHRRSGAFASSQRILSKQFLRCFIIITVSSPHPSHFSPHHFFYTAKSFIQFTNNRSIFENCVEKKAAIEDMTAKCPGCQEPIKIGDGRNYMFW